MVRWASTFSTNRPTQMSISSSYVYSRPGYEQWLTRDGGNRSTALVEGRKIHGASPRNQGTFWPKDWLPSEAGFENVRIHSYGYNWASKGGRHPTVLQFSQAFLADLHNSPYLKKHAHVGVPIPLLVNGADMRRRRSCLSPIALGV